MNASELKQNKGETDMRRFNQQNEIPMWRISSEPRADNPGGFFAIQKYEARGTVSSIPPRRESTDRELPNLRLRRKR
jgi:hypothetical protein